MTLQINEQIHRGTWDLLTCDSAYHSWWWFEIIREVYGLEPLFALLKDGDGFALIASFKTIKGYVSLPYLSYSGYLGSSEGDIAKLKAELGRMGVSIDDRTKLPFSDSSVYVGSVARIPSLDSYWNSLASKMRNQIRKSESQGFVVKEDKTVNSFFKVYSQCMHRLGTPVHRKSFFETILKTYKTSGIVTVYDQEEPVASMFYIYDNSTVYDLWAACLDSYSPRYANYLLYWTTIKKVLSLGCKQFDLGRSTNGSGVFQFKQKFGVENYTINSQINYNQSKLSLASQIWPHLPAPMVQVVGPMIRKYLP